MPGSFSSKKVARAARTGGSRRRDSNTPIGWYSTLAVIVIVGIGLVGFSVNERRDANNPGDTPPLAAFTYPDGETREGDRWFEAYGFYTCDKFAPNIDPGNDPFGITTRNDGVILIAPIERDYAGRNATLGLFAQGAGIELDRAGFKVPGDETSYREGAKCGDKDAKLVVREWENASDPNSGETVQGNPSSLLLKNNAAVTVAWVPEDFQEDQVPLPPSAANLADIVAADQAAASGGQVPATGGAPAAPADPAAPAADPAAPAAP